MCVHVCVRLSVCACVHVLAYALARSTLARNLRHMDHLTFVWVCSSFGIVDHNSFFIIESSTGFSDLHFLHLHPVVSVPCHLLMLLFFKDVFKKAVKVR